MLAFYQASIPNAHRFSLGTGRTDFFLSSVHRLVSVCILRLCMHPVTSPVTAPAASVARHGTQVPHTHTTATATTQTDDTHRTQPRARGYAGRAGRGGAGARGRAGGAATHLTVLLCIVGCVRQLDPRDHGAGGAAEQIRRPVQQGRPPQVPCSHAPAPRGFLPSYLSRFRSWLIECGVC